VHAVQTDLAVRLKPVPAEQVLVDLQPGGAQCPAAANTAPVASAPACFIGWNATCTGISAYQGQSYSARRCIAATCSLLPRRQPASLARSMQDPRCTLPIACWRAIRTRRASGVDVHMTPVGSRYS
jgi:hypothetical protein